MTAKQIKEQEVDEAIERRRLEFNDDGFEVIRGEETHGKTISSGEFLAGVDVGQHKMELMFFVGRPTRRVRDLR